MALFARESTKENEDKWKESLKPEEKGEIEGRKAPTEDVPEHFHADSQKKSGSAGDDWAYVDDGFDAEISDYVTHGGKMDDHLSDIVSALSTWRVALSGNYVLDDVLNQSQDVPTATAYGDLVRLIDDYSKDERAWTAEKKSVKNSLIKLKNVSTRLNETMMKTLAECYSDIDEDTTYRELSDIAPDPTGYKKEQSLKPENKRVFERLNSYDDEIRGEKDMSRVVSAFIPDGQGNEWMGKERKHTSSFAKDYAAESEEKRRPYLDILTKKMYDIAISVEMLTPEYMADNMVKMEYFRTQLSYFEDVRNDPLNAAFFHRFAEKDQKKLDIIDKISTSFTPGDFAKNVNDVNTREKWYRPDARDQVRIDQLLRGNSSGDMINDFMYDTKLSTTRLKSNEL